MNGMVDADEEEAACAVALVTLAGSLSILVLPLIATAIGLVPSDFGSWAGGAVHDVLDGVYDADGAVPCQIDGGLKCFGHPIGASGLRMVYEMYLQLQGRAGARQLTAPRLGLTHNLGGFPHLNVASIAILGAA